MCREHSRATCPEHAHRILDEILLQRKRDDSSVGDINERVKHLKRSIEKRDTTMAMRAYDAGRQCALLAGADNDEAHRRGLLRVWRSSRSTGNKKIK